MTMSGLNPNGFQQPQMAPRPGMGIMAMMASAVPQPQIGGVLPAMTPLPTVVDNVPLNSSTTLLAPPTNIQNGESTVKNRRKSSSPSVSLINLAGGAKKGSEGGVVSTLGVGGGVIEKRRKSKSSSINSCESESLMAQTNTTNTTTNTATSTANGQNNNNTAIRRPSYERSFY